MTRREFLQRSAIAAVAGGALVVGLAGSRLPAEIRAGEPLDLVCGDGVEVDGAKAGNVAAVFPRTGEVEELVRGAPGEVFASRVRRPESVRLLWKAGHGPAGASCSVCAWTRGF